MVGKQRLSQHAENLRYARPAKRGGPHLLEQHALHTKASTAPPRCARSIPKHSRHRCLRLGRSQVVGKQRLSRHAENLRYARPASRMMPLGMVPYLLWPTRTTLQARRRDRLARDLRHHLLCTVGVLYAGVGPRATRPRRPRARRPRSISRARFQNPYCILYRVSLGIRLWDGELG